jgi:RimJ/RimL family protein N-acetyltransferase
MADEFIIRHAKPEDLESFRALRLEALKNHPDVFGMDYFDAASKENEYWISRLKINPVEDALFFAEKDSQLVGMTGIHRSMATKARHSPFIWGVYVKPEYRGNHISESLIRACLEWAKTQKEIVIIKLAVVTHNIPAIRCYERCGFITYGTEPKAICYEDVYYDEYLMSLEVSL